MNHTAIMLNGHIDPSFLHMGTKTHPSAISNLHIIAMHVPATNIFLKCHIYSTYANQFMSAYDRTMSVKTSHMNSLQWTM